MSHTREHLVSLPSKSLNSAEIRKIVWNISAPALVEMVLVSLVGMVDMIQVGRLGAVAITSVGLSNQPMMLLQSVFQALNVGTTALVARSVGMGKPDQASHALKQSLAVTILLGLMGSLLLGTCGAYVLRFLGAEPDVVAVGTPYFSVAGWGFIFNALSMSVAAGLRGSGDTRTPMTVNLVANFVNIFWNWVLIWGKFGFPRWGAFGAGVATTLSRLVSCIWFVSIILRGRNGIRLNLKEPYRPDWVTLRRISNVGLPAAAEQLILRSGQLTFSKVVSSLGTVMYAAHQVSMNILSLTFMPGQAFATGCAALVGQYLGAERPDEAEQCAVTSRNMGLAMGIAMALVFLFFGKYLTALYTNDVNVILVSSLLLKIYALVQPAQSTQFILAGGLRGAGDARFPLYTTMVGMWVGRVLLGWFMAHVLHLGLPGAWIGMGIDQIVRAALIQIQV